MTPWPHQAKAVQEFFRHFNGGGRELCLTIPTGGGKTWVASRIMEALLGDGACVGLFSNRKIVTSQASAALASMGLHHGVIAAGYDLDTSANLYVASIQTVQSRAWDRQSVELPKFDLAIIDEAHNRGFDGVVKWCRDRAIPYLGLTATPIGIGDNYSTLIQAGVPSELRRCGALVPCYVYAPTEPDMKGVKKTATGEFSPQGDTRIAQYCYEVWGNVFEEWRRLNPQRRPTMLFAPSVEVSQWFSAQFLGRGVSADHIDGNTSELERERIMERSRAGRCDVLCSHGVLREGANLPWVEHCILLQVCGRLTTYLQLVGRILRAHHGKASCVLQDHSGAWWRHGSPNEDREWSLKDTDKSLARERDKSQGNGTMPQPIRCPKCGAIRKAGPVCPACKHEHKQSVRTIWGSDPVLMTPGELVDVRGPAVKVKQQKSQDQRTWTACLYRCAQRGLTVAQAMGLFRQETGHGLPADVKPRPPAEQADCTRRVADVYEWLTKRRKATS